MLIQLHMINIGHHDQGTFFHFLLHLVLNDLKQKQNLSPVQGSILLKLFLNF